MVTSLSNSPLDSIARALRNRPFLLDREIFQNHENREWCKCSDVNVTQLSVAHCLSAGPIIASFRLALSQVRSRLLRFAHVFAHQWISRAHRNPLWSIQSTEAETGPKLQ
jgi:hypothetical protein